jgi:propionyl-CoA carboxylase alpha chain
VRRIEKLLVANRGEIALRVLRTCRELGIATVAVFSEPDRDAPFVAEADEAIALGGATSRESYLRADAIVEAAVRAKADAVHPGYGFLAESADFARRCAAADLVFVGPSPETIAAMGSKWEAKRIARDAGVPTLPELAVAADEDAGLADRAAPLGWPLLVKASAGGGGRGMRIVTGESELQEALAAARREAVSAFGDGTLFLERYVQPTRHVEIQILGDAHGRIVQLHERECSIQRRHQKVIEEAPSTAVDVELRARMGAAAVAVAEAIGYVGAGTVEFLLQPDGEFFFLEMNTRLQVEHPVTELVTGLDLVALQLLVAAGEPLPDEATHAPLVGHAIEARLYAEDPRNEFAPTGGTAHRLYVEPAPGLRVDAGIADGSRIALEYDPLLVKLIAHGRTRDEAARRLAHALERMHLHGVTTNRDLLVRVLRHPEFLRGETDTGFLDRHSAARLGAPLLDAGGERIHALAAALAGQAARRALARVLPAAPSGWRNNPSQPQTTAFEGEYGRIEVRYACGRTGVSADVGGESLETLRVGSCEPGAVELELDGVRRRFDVHAVGDTWYVDSPLGHSALRELDRFPQPGRHVAPGSLVSPMPGSVVSVAVSVGERVEHGDLLLVVEAMKMEHRITAPAAGTVTEIGVDAGQAVEKGTVLAVVDPEEQER